MSALARASLARSMALSLLAALGGVALLAAACIAALASALAPAPGAWTATLRIGPISRGVDMAALIRLATHPIGLALLDGRSTATPYGRWQWHRGAGDELQGVCSPCTLPLPALGSQPLVLPHVELTVRRLDMHRFRGDLTLVEGTHRVPLRWRARLDDRKGIVVDGDLGDVPLADAYAVLGRTAVPELARMHIEGHLRAHVRARWPGGSVSVRPVLDDFAVSGLGTQALVGAVPPSACAPTSGSKPVPARIIGWLPHAVIAAEDQRFDEHRGYDLRQMLAAWSSNQQGEGLPQGASTLTQQLAKLLYVGDERSATRKLRELLYAVEMERTLGKGRILQLYLAMAPWGQGVCGAEAAARHYLHKSTSRLTPLEAAWLASLLQAPPHEGEAATVDKGRVGWILSTMRGPLPAERRAAQIDALRDWAPPAPPTHTAAARTAAERTP